jgi:hypothetical protein
MLPKEGFGRIDSRKNNRFDRIELPQLEGRRWGSLIQYN